MVINAYTIDIIFMNAAPMYVSPFKKGYDAGWGGEGSDACPDSSYRDRYTEIVIQYYSKFFMKDTQFKQLERIFSFEF